MLLYLTEVMINWRLAPNLNIQIFYKGIRGEAKCAQSEAVQTLEISSH